MGKMHVLCYRQIASPNTHKRSETHSVDQSDSRTHSFPVVNPCLLQQEDDSGEKDNSCLAHQILTKALWKWVMGGRVEQSQRAATCIFPALNVQDCNSNWKSENHRANPSVPRNVMYKNTVTDPTKIVSITSTWRRRKTRIARSS